MDKFVLAMLVMAIALVVVIGGGFVATEYFKQHPEIFRVPSKQ